MEVAKMFENEQGVVSQAKFNKEVKVLLQSEILAIQAQLRNWKVEQKKTLEKISKEVAATTNRTVKSAKQVD